MSLGAANVTDYVLAFHPAQWPVILASSSRSFPNTHSYSISYQYHLCFAGADGAVNCFKMVTSEQPEELVITVIWF